MSIEQKKGGRSPAAAEKKLLECLQQLEGREETPLLLSQALQFVSSRKNTQLSNKTNNVMIKIMLPPSNYAV